MSEESDLISQLLTTTENILEPVVSKEYPKLFTDIYPTEIGTILGRNETLTCLVILLNKTLTQGLENYEAWWYKTNLENKLEIKDLVFVIKNITDSDLDSYLCKIKDKRSGEFSENIGNSTLRLKTEEELKEEEDDDLNLEFVSPATVETLEYPKLFTDIYPTEIGTILGRNETLTCLVILLNKTLTEGLEFYEAWWYKTNLENRLEIKDLVFVIKNITDSDLDNYFCKVKDKRSGEFSENIGKTNIRLKTEEELKEEEEKDGFDFETLGGYDVTSITEEISSSTKSNAQTTDEVTEKEIEITTTTTTESTEKTTPISEITSTPITMTTTVDIELFTTADETTIEKEVVTTLIEKSTIVEDTKTTSTFDETTSMEETTNAEETTTIDKTTPSAESTPNVIPTSTPTIEDTTTPSLTTPIWSRPDFVIYASFSSQEIVYLANGENFILTCTSYSTYSVPLNTMIYKDRVIYNKEILWKNNISRFVLFSFFF
jgi:hypothetical protein